MLNMLIPAVILPGIIFTLMALYPFIEAMGHRRQEPAPPTRPSSQRTDAYRARRDGSVLLPPALGPGWQRLDRLHLRHKVFSITWFMRAAIFVVPPLVFIITKRICFGLQRRDRDKLLHGYESGVIKRLPSGKYYEQHQPISDEERAVILARHDAPLPLPIPEKYDANGIKQKGYGVKLLRAKLSHFFYDERLPIPTQAEIEEANHHEAEVTAGRDHEIDDARAKALTPHE